MARTKGTYTLTSNIEPKVGAPLDARTIVKLKTDLTANNTFEYPYKGMTVFVEEENKKYTLVGTDPTISSNWVLNNVPQVQSNYTENDEGSPSYIQNKPTLGTAAAKDIPVSGNAGNDQVVLGSDGRLSDARPASDVHEWAKASTKPAYNYSEINNTPTLGTAAAKDVPTTGDAGETEVVLGNDSRLSDARNAKDVHDWAKASSKPSYNYSEINNTPTLGTAAAKDVPTSGNASDTQVVMGNDSRLTDARTPLSHTHTLNQITDAGTAATKNVPTTGNADTSQVVMGNDTRLTDARTPLSHTHTLNQITDAGTAAAKNVPSSGNAATTEVVMGNDTRLTDSRNAKDVYNWAKAASKPTYAYSEITNTPTLGTAAAKDYATSVTEGGTDLVTAGAVWSAIDNLPEPMIIKGTLGTGGTITSLPTASASNEGYTYKVITAGTYDSQAAKVGDLFVSYNPVGTTTYSWLYIPSGDESFTDTWRNIKIKGTEKLGTSITTGAVDFVDGTNTTVGFNATGNKISYSVPAVSATSAGVAPKGATVSTQSQTTKFLREDGSWAAPSYTTNTDRYVNTAAFADNSSNDANNPVKMTLTRAGSDSATVTAKIPKVSHVSAGVVPKGTAVSTQSQTTKFLREDGTWAAPSYTTNTNTTYTFANGTNGFTVTPSNGSAQTVTVTPSITNNVTGSGTSGYLTKFNGTNTITNGPQLGSAVSSQTQSTKFLREDGTWAAPSYTTNTDTKNTAGSTDTSSKIFLVGATSQATNPQTYSDNELYVTSGVLSAKEYTGTYVNVTKTGTGTAATTSGSNYIPAKWSLNLGITAAEGDIITFTVPVAGHSYGVFLSVNNGTNYYPISVSGTSRLTTHYGVGTTISVVFDADGSTADVFPLAGGTSRTTVSGGCWRIINYYDSGNSNTYDRNLYNATIKAGSSAIVAGNIIVGKDGVFHHLKDGTAFDITYPILYASSNISASGTSGSNYDVIAFTVTTTQSITLTAYKPVFIKGTLAGNIFTPVNTTPLTQTVPNSDDGYEYVLLGVAYSTTAIYLDLDHRVFAYKNSVFGEVVNYAALAAFSNNSARLSNTTKIGDTNKPVYFTANGVPAAISYTIDKSVPSDAKFTDTTYSAVTTSANGLMTSTDKSKLNKINEAHYQTTGSTTKIKIKINSTKQWMLSFIVSLYQGYRATRVQVSGYQYGNNYWHQPEAVLLASSDNTSVKVYFGYDSVNNLWVGFDGAEYTGVSVDNVTNGFYEIEDYSSLFTITNVSSLSTLQTTLTCYSNHYTAAPTADQVLVASSANGGIKTSGYTIAKSVPSNADFTNTWRGIQNNLTSDSTTDSLSAAQGKALANGSARDSTKVAKAGDTMTGILNMSTTNNVAFDFRPGNHNYHSTVSHQSSGNEALVFANQYNDTSFIFINGEDSITNHGGARWQSLTSPGIQIKQNCVNIGGLWGNGVNADYKLRVNGNSFLNGSLTLSVNNAASGSARMEYNSTTKAIDFVFV